MQITLTLLLVHLHNCRISWPGVSSLQQPQIADSVQLTQTPMEKRGKRSCCAAQEWEGRSLTDGWALNSYVRPGGGKQYACSTAGHLYASPAALIPSLLLLEAAHHTTVTVTITEYTTSRQVTVLTITQKIALELTKNQTRFPRLIQTWRSICLPSMQGKDKHNIQNHSELWLKWIRRSRQRSGGRQMQDCPWSGSLVKWRVHRSLYYYVSLFAYRLHIFLLRVRY